MARTLISVQTVTDEGVAPVYNSANAEGNAIVNEGTTLLEFLNETGAAITVTVGTSATVDGLGVAERLVIVPGGATRIAGPFPASIYNQPDGCIYLDYSSATGLSVVALRF